MERLIIYGGSFDPITNAHMRIARGASFILNSELVFVPSKSPRWKEVSASIEDRVNMLKLAIKDEGLANFTISLFEVNNDAEINYSIDTVKYFKNKYKNKEIYLLIGADQVNQFEKWKDALEIAKLVHIAYVKRDDIALNKENIDKFNMIELNIPNIGDVSSTKVRNLESLDIPYKVIKYIEENNLYYIERVKSYLSIRRYNHSVSVANLSYKIALNNKLDPGKAYISGLLHDIGKEYEPTRVNRLMNAEFLEFNDMPKSLYHQFVGSYIAETQFDIKDKDILDAIKYHASGKKEMGPYGKITYAADKIDPLRGYDSSDMIKACMSNINEGFKYVLNENRIHLLKEGKDIYNRLTNECMIYYLKKE